ncbi:proline oxidase PrnD [Trichodelitschia bisporula]|uniref:Proline dehydrogenase n=1 Tax=Trichodelitschia bisporula TaxID=703511 RepID=A0A6G1I7X2_9PEZI|nr:proline oxidase PrnD [Trichodelitschia bisporula]
MNARLLPHSRPLRISVKSSYLRSARRTVHSTRRAQAIVSAAPELQNVQPPSSQRPTSHPATLSILPTSSVLRTYIITRMTSSPFLLNACFAVLTRMIESKSTIFNVDKNPLLRYLFKRTFYAQFCAGENKAEVQQTIERVRGTGFNGVILEYALEVLKGGDSSEARAAQEIAAWRKGMLETVDMAKSGDFVALKWSGLGIQALQLLKANQPATKPMWDAIIETCALAAKKGVYMLPGAEEENMNDGIDSWSLALEKKYNREAPGKAIVYNTYQAYLRSTPAKLAKHLAEAQRDGYTLGVKMVRGAYMASEPPSRIWSSKEETDKIYDALVEALLKRQYNDILMPAPGATASNFPQASLMIASHNAESIQKAQEIRNGQAKRGEPSIECYYAQLQGMADEVSCELVQESRSPATHEKTVPPKAYKCATWGTVGECLAFLIRRAAENKDAAGRTMMTRKAMAQELIRRTKALVGLA